MQALGGAKNFMVVMPDAVMPKTVGNIIGSAFGAAGQRCMAGSVVIAVGDAKVPLMEELVPRTRELAVGDGLDHGTDVGPVVSCASRDRILEWIERGIGDGATLAVDGRSPSANSEGAFVGPTILDAVTPDMDVAQEEIFGPVLSVIHAASLDEAIEIVNASRYGNGTSIFTESGAAVRRYRHDVEVGMIGVNVGVAAPVAFFPFSGWKGSFFGDLHAHGPDAVEVLHAQEDGHIALLLGRRDGPLLHRAGRSLGGMMIRFTGVQVDVRRRIGGVGRRERRRAGWMMPGPRTIVASGVSQRPVQRRAARGTDLPITRCRGSFP